MAIRVLVHTPDFRVSVMGSKLVVNFHKRYASLFAPIIWEFTDAAHVSFLCREARALIEGRYNDLCLMETYEQVQPVPADSLGINFARFV